MQPASWECNRERQNANSMYHQSVPRPSRKVRHGGTTVRASGMDMTADRRRQPPFDGSRKLPMLRETGCGASNDGACNGSREGFPVPRISRSGRQAEGQQGPGADPINHARRPLKF